MAPKVIRSECVNCHASFNTYDPNMIFCNLDCKWKWGYAEKMGKPHNTERKQCVWCGKGIPNTKGNLYCDKECNSLKNKAERREEACKKSMTGDKRFIPKGVSITELNRRSEYNRLYDKFHINRIIRGKS